MSKANILIVEDEYLIANDLSSMLKRMGYEVLDILSCGEDVLQKVSEVSPDLVLMDIRLGGDMDGIEAAKQIKDRSNIPIMYLTANADEVTLNRAMITEPYGYILKPIEERELQICIAMALYKHKMEEALIQSEKMKSLGTITAGISHEFNNILNIISGKVQLLQMDYNDNSELKDELSTIMESIDDGVAITDNMLKITKLGNSTSEYEPFYLNELLEQSIEFMKPRWKSMAQANGIDYIIDQKGIENVSQLLCNPTEIREVFTNIINNALDAMPDGGTITVATRCVRSEELGVESKKGNASELRTQNSELKGDFVEITLADTGKGMTKEVKSLMFDPFFTTRCPEGTGLGMSMAYGIIIRHGGKIEVNSEVGKGTTLTLQFPTTNKKVSPTATLETEQEINIKNLRILVVDDEEDFCDIMDKFLSRKGHNVKTVDNGADAIGIIKAEDFDLVLSDIGMLCVNGYEVARAINKLEKRPKIGIITGWREKLERFDEEDTKADFILKKPFKLPELSKHINDLFGADS